MVDYGEGEEGEQHTYSYDGSRIKLPSPLRAEPSETSAPTPTKAGVDQD